MAVKQPTLSIRMSQAIRSMLARRLSIASSPSEVLSRAAARYDEVCQSCVPSELTDRHWEMIFEALCATAASDSGDLEPARTTLRDYVALYAHMPPPVPVAVHLAACMERWTYAEWVAVVDRAERRWALPLRIGLADQLDS